MAHPSTGALKEGREEGIEKGRTAFAARMLHLGLLFEQVTAVSQLSVHLSQGPVSVSSAETRGIFSCSATVFISARSRCTEIGR